MIALILVTIILARDIVIPMMIAGILTVVLMPIVKNLEQKNSSTLAISLVLVNTLILFAIVGILIANQLASVLNNLPDLETKFNSWVDQVISSLRSELGMSVKEQNQFLKNSLTSLGRSATALFSATTNLISLLEE